MKLLIDELVHFSLAFLVGVICYLNFGNPWLILVALAFGFLIDVDHLFDYFAHFGFKFNLKEFLQINYMESSGKIFVLLHAWELVPVFWLVGFCFEVPGLSWTMSGAYLGHLLWDQVHFPHHPLMYFLIFRSHHKFNLTEMLASK